MKQVEFILFDCMETLVDVREIPDARTRAIWTLRGSGVEHLWTGDEEFYGHYQRAMSEIEKKRGEYDEFDLRDRIAHICRFNGLEDGTDTYAAAGAALYRNYCENYYARCYVRDDARAGLASLAGSYKMAVVSNHVIRGGVNEMLCRLDIREYFQFVVTSIDDTGLRKPHPSIFSLAARMTGVSVDRILFVGDDLVNDYEGPRKFGMQACLLDREGRRDGAVDRVRGFSELATRLKST
jgi:putative hydrolase of the HAD superfamily